MKAIGITCGIGSMLIGARQAGFDVLGNVEWRKYYHAQDDEGRNTFKENYPGAFFGLDPDEILPEDVSRMRDAELAMGHPECGNFSNLRRNRETCAEDPGDIPLFTRLVDWIKPRFFVMDDLPKSLVAYGMLDYANALSDYDLFPEWVSNYHYGNVQKYRKRFFMIGALKDERWSFVPGEDPELEGTLANVIKDLRDDEGRPRPGFHNHFSHVLDVVTGRARNISGYGDPGTWKDMRDWFLDKPTGTVLEYQSQDGPKRRIGLIKSHWDGPCNVLTGTNPVLHPLTNLPLSMRERARVQGFPDDFVLYSEKLDDEGRWNHDRSNDLVKQTGKAMPVQFCRYVSEQIAAHVRGESFEASNTRSILSNEHVDRAKREYCEELGYSDQERACDCCWLHDCCETRSRKFQIDEPEIGQTDAFEPGTVPVRKPKPKISKKSSTAKRGRYSDKPLKQKTMVFEGGNE